MPRKTRHHIELERTQELALRAVGAFQNEGLLLACMRVRSERDAMHQTIIKILESIKEVNHAK